MALESSRESSWSLQQLVPGPPDTNMTVTVDSLLDMLRPLGSFAEPLRDLTALLVAETGESPFEVRFGKWSWDAAVSTLQSAIATAVLLPVCHTTGTNDVPVVVLSVVLPFLVNVERIEVRDSDLFVLAQIKDELFFPNDLEKVYDALPPDLRHEISLLEFRDLVQRLLGSGHLTRTRLGRYKLTRQAYKDLLSRLT